jgi:hypothetical protein
MLQRRSPLTGSWAQVDNFFKRTANKLSKADNLRVYVITDDSKPSSNS